MRLADGLNAKSSSEGYWRARRGFSPILALLILNVDIKYCFILSVYTSQRCALLLSPEIQASIESYNRAHQFFEDELAPRGVCRIKNGSCPVALQA